MKKGTAALLAISFILLASGAQCFTERNLAATTPTASSDHFSRTSFQIFLWLPVLLTVCVLVGAFVLFLSGDDHKNDSIIYAKFLTAYEDNRS